MNMNLSYLPSTVVVLYRLQFQIKLQSSLLPVMRFQYVEKIRIDKISTLFSTKLAAFPSFLRTAASNNYFIAQC